VLFPSLQQQQRSAEPIKLARNFLLLPPCRSAKCRNKRVCMFVCLFVCRISQKPHVQISPNFLYMLPVAMDRSSSDNNQIRYGLPVLRMTSCVYIIERTGRIRDDTYVSSSSPGGSTSRTPEDVDWLSSRQRHRGRSLPVCRFRLHLV